MNKQFKPIAMAVLFLAGCAVGGASSRFMVPPASAQQAALTRWDYHCFAATSKITQRANLLGAEGWELVAAAGVGGDPVLRENTMVWCFKRPRP